MFGGGNFLWIWRRDFVCEGMDYRKRLLNNFSSFNLTSVLSIYSFFHHWCVKNILLISEFILAKTRVKRVSFVAFGNGVLEFHLFVDW